MKYRPQLKKTTTKMGCIISIIYLLHADNHLSLWQVEDELLRLTIKGNILYSVHDFHY